MDYSKLVVLIKDEFETLDVISETLGLLSLFIRMQKIVSTHGSVLGLQSPLFERNHGALRI